MLIVCTATGLTLSESNIPARVLKIRLGSTAAYSGIRGGDMLLDAKLDNNILSVTFERGGTKFQARMAVDAKALKSMITEIPGPKTPHIQLPSEAQSVSAEPKAVGLSRPITEEEATAIISGYTFIILVDRSGSMGSPVSGPNDGSKLDWLKNQMNSFCSFLEANNNGGRSTLIEFDSRHTAYLDVTPGQVRSIVSSLQPRGGTNIATPTQEALDIAMRQGRRELIVVLSDGMHNLGPSLAHTIIQATHKIAKPGDMVISFIEIGHSSPGMDSIRSLDQDLVSQGAKYDVVDARYFDDVVQFGMKRILADAVLRARSPRP